MCSSLQCAVYTLDLYNRSRFHLLGRIVSMPAIVGGYLEWEEKNESNKPILFYIKFK